MDIVTHTCYILLLALVRCALLLPFFAISRNDYVKHNFNYIGLFFSFFVLDQVMLYVLKDVRFFNGQQWNWGGKAAECILAILFIATTLLTKKDAGLTPAVKHPVKTVGIITTILLITFAIEYFAGGTKNRHSNETFWFQLLMPGIAEELVFRGILLGLLNKAYIKTIIVWQTPMGWGVLVTSALFGLVHSFNFAGHDIDFNIQYFLSTFTMGLLFAFIKEKSQSLLPGIICHNLFNLIVTYV